MAEIQKDDTRGVFPVLHDKCPVCGSKERLGQQVVDELKKDKTLPEAFGYAGITLQAALLDPAHPPTILASTFTIKVMLLSLDVCANPDCGAVYCTTFSVVDRPAQLGTPQQVKPTGQQMLNRQMRRHQNRG